MKISSPGKDKLMERNFSLEKRPEGTARSTGKSGPRRWEIEQYRYQEEPTDNQRPLHGDPRDKHDNDFIPSDDDSEHEYGLPGVGIGPVPDFYASTSFASDQGTLAGVKLSEAGKWAKEKLSSIERENLAAYWKNRNKGTESTQEQKAARSKYKSLHSGYKRGETTSKSTEEVGRAKWRATKDTQAGSSDGKLGHWIIGHSKFVQ